MVPPVHYHKKDKPKAHLCSFDRKTNSILINDHDINQKIKPLNDKTETIFFLLMIMVMMHKNNKHKHNIFNIPLIWRNQTIAKYNQSEYEKLREC